MSVYYALLYMIIAGVEEGRAAVTVTALEQLRVARCEKHQLVFSAVVGGPVERGERGPQQPTGPVPQRTHWPFDKSPDSCHHARKREH